MAHKRSRNATGGEHGFVAAESKSSDGGFGNDNSDKHSNSNSNNSNDDDEFGDAPLLSLFGGETIHAIQGGNSTFARGGFGELSIALRLRSRPQSPPPPSASSSSSPPSTSTLSSSSSSSGGDGDTGHASLYSFVAVKTIHNAIAKPNSGGGRFGGFGGSFSASQNEQQQKQQQEQQQQLSNEVMNELLALRLLQSHPNIVPLVAVFPGKHHHHPGTGSLSLAFSYSPIDLREVLEVRRMTFRPPLAFRFLRTILGDVLAGIAHCHATGILHRDVKPGNLLVSSKGTVQLCDFGLARPFLVDEETDAEAEADTEAGEGIRAKATTSTSTSSGIGIGSHPPEKALCTLYYRPPEVLLGGPSEHPSVDVWSAGVVLAELVTGRPLWPGRNAIDQLSLVFDALGTPDETNWPSVKDLPDYGKLNFGTKPPKSWEDHLLPRAAETPGLVHLLSKMIALAPNRRLSARDALDHHWLQQQPVNKHKDKDKPNTTDAASEPPTSRAGASYRELRNELLRPAKLDVPPLLFPGDRAVVGALGLELAKSRRSIRAPPGDRDGHWKGPTVVLVPPALHE